MFERLIKRIPIDVDAHDVHEYVGKDFTYMHGNGNSMNQGVYMVPFIVSDRLYCVHITDSKPREISVYLISTHGQAAVASPPNGVSFPRGKTVFWHDWPYCARYLSVPRPDRTPILGCRLVCTPVGASRFSHNPGR